MPDLKPGSVFAGHRIEAVAGRGGMGTVYRATHLALDHVVALKVISPELAADRAFRERFRSETRIAVSLRHPNVVPIHHAGEEDGLLFVTMDLIDGPDLRKLVAGSGGIEPERALRLLSGVADALDVAHSRGLVHRDIKPANILVEAAGTSRERAFLTDFGLAKRFDEGTDAAALTKTGAFVGTLDYVAPEQIRGERVDARTDVYALGCVLFQAISGEAPFSDRGENVAKMYAHLQEEPPSLPGAEGTALDEVIARAMAKEPRERYPSAGDLARAAAGALEPAAAPTVERSVATGEAAPESEEVEATTATELPRVGLVDRRAPLWGPPWGRVGLAVLTLAVVIAGLLLLAGVFDGSGEGGRSDPAAETTAEQPNPSVSGRPIEVSGFPVGIAAGGGTVVVATRATSMALINEGSGAVEDTPALPGEGEEVAVGGGVAWASLPDAGALVRTPLSGGGPEPVEVGGRPMGVAVGGDGTVWAANADLPGVAKVDPGTGAVESFAIDGAGFPSRIAVGGGRLWVVDRERDRVYALDESDPSADPESFEVGSNPKGVDVGAGSLWVANTDDGTVSRLDAESGERQATIEVGGTPRGVAFGFGRVWVANGEGYVSAIDPADESVARVPIKDGSPEEVAIGSDLVWVTTGKGDTVVRINPAP